MRTFIYTRHELSQQCLQGVLGNCGCVLWCKCTDDSEVLDTFVVREAENLVVDFKSFCVYFIYLYS